MNLLSKRPLGAWTVWLGDYKTFKSRGVDETSFTEELFSDLNDVLNQYLLQGYRNCLVNDSAHRYVFVNTMGAKFESSSYSKYLSSLLFRLTGSKSTSNILRSSFVVNLLESPEGHDSSIRASVASLMHHSVEQQSQTYDRRNPTSRKYSAQSFISKRGREPEEPINQLNHRSLKVAASRFSRGDFVVVPFLDSVKGTPRFWFAKVMGDDGAEVTLMELIPADSGAGYRAILQSIWKEPTSAVFHVDAIFDQESSLYILISSKEEIMALI
jgi:hypothetical protein